MQKLIAFSAAIVSLATATNAIAAPVDTIDGSNPAIFFRQLQEMGYEPEPFSKEGAPTTVFQSGGDSYNLVLGGCTNGKACTYMVMLGSFTDVINPPANWIITQNVDFDMIKVWVNDSKVLTYSTPVIATGLTRAGFKATIDMFIESGNSLAREAVNAGLLTPAKSTEK